MSAASDTSLALSVPLTGDELRGQLMADYELTYGRTIRGDTLEALVVIQRWLDRCWQREHELLTTVPTAAHEIGWPVTGSGRRDGIRFRNSLTRRLDMLLEMGWIDSWEPIYDERGSGEGILVRARRDSSVGRAILLLADQPPLGLLECDRDADLRLGECQRGRRVSEGSPA